MANNTTLNQRRQPGRKAADIEKAWSELAPDAVFRNIPLADLQAARVLVNDSTAEVERLNRARAAASQIRDEATTQLRELCHTVVRGVEGHGDYGDDSPLYRAMGFVPKSQRSSGLTRRSAPPPANNEAVA